jgi:hypothetical protein
MKTLLILVLLINVYFLFEPSTTMKINVKDFILT